MGWSKEGDPKGSKKCCLQKMWRVYWTDSGAGRKSCNNMGTAREYTYLGECRLRM